MSGAAGLAGGGEHVTRLRLHMGAGGAGGTSGHGADGLHLSGDGFAQGGELAHEKVIVIRQVATALDDDQKPMLRELGDAAANMPFTSPHRFGKAGNRDGGGHAGALIGAGEQFEAHEASGSGQVAAGSKPCGGLGAGYGAGG